MKDRDNVGRTAVTNEGTNARGIEVRVPCRQSVKEGTRSPLREDHTHNHFLFDFGCEGNSTIGGQIFTR